MGPDFPLMLDCYMALSATYAARLARRLEPLGLKWMEEFLPPDDYTGYKQVKLETFLFLSGSSWLTTLGDQS